MDARDFETAAGYIATYLTFDKQAIDDIFKESILSVDDGVFSGDNVVDTVSQAAVVMDKAQIQITDMAVAEFDKAVKASDEERLFKMLKLFPKIGKADVGLVKFSEHMCHDIIRKHVNFSPSTGEQGFPSFVDTLTALFEVVALVVDKQRPVISQLYGSGSMLYVIRACEGEADLLAARVLDMFGEKRDLTRKVTESSIVSNDSASRGVELRELGGLLDEIAGICNRATVFQSFLAARAKTEIELVNSAPSAEDELNRVALQSLLSDPQQQKFSNVSGLLKLSTLTTKSREMVSIFYIPLESAFLRRSVQKAMRMDTFDSASEEKISSFVEDSFFIFKKVLLRSIGTQNIGAACAIINVSTHVLETDYLNDGLVNKLNSFGGEKAPELSERADAVVGYMILLNNLEVSAIYLKKLVSHVDEVIFTLLAEKFGWDDESSGDESTPLDSQQYEKEKERISMCLSPMRDLVNQFTNILNKGVTAMFIQVIKSRLRSLFQECFTNSKYVLTDEEYSQTELIGGYPAQIGGSYGLGEGALANFAASVGGSAIAASQGTREGAVSRFMAQFNLILKTVCNNYLVVGVNDLVVMTCVELFVHDWERQLMKPAASGSLQDGGIKFNSLGAVRLDKDLRMISTFLNGKLKSGSARDKFSRLSQISLIVNLEAADEISEYYRHNTGEDDEIQWRLTPQEIRNVLSMRFGQNAVSKVQL